MNRQTKAIRNEISKMAEDAHALVTATAGVAEEAVGEARERLAAALDRGRDIYGSVLKQEGERAMAANKLIHDHPYKTIAIGVGVGALIGFFAGHRCNSSRD